MQFVHKLSILILSFLHTIILYSQTKTEILLVGTAHQPSATIIQDTSFLINAVKRFKPDAIAIESIPSWDSVSLKNYRLKYLLKADSMKRQMGWTGAFIKVRIAQLTNSVNWNSKEIKVYDTLAYYYILDGDIYGNSGYNWFIAERLHNSGANWSSDFHGTELYQWSRKFLVNSEFFAIIYPFALQSQIKYLHPVDDQTDAPQFRNYQRELTKSMISGIFVFNFKGLKVQKLIKKQEAAYKKAEQEGKLFELVNNNKFQQEVSELLENIYPKYSKSKWAKRLKETWDMRNERIAERIISIQQAEPTGRRIVVFIGAAHIGPLKKILLRSGNLHVRTIYDLNNQ